MENENLQPIEKLTPFTKMIMTIGTLPSSFYASMSYYESMVWLYEYLKNTVIPTVNNNAESVEELQTAFIQLETWVHDYFDEQLPIEVQNALDNMAEDGSLTELIENVLKAQNYVILNDYEELLTNPYITKNLYVRLKNYEENDKIESVYYIKEKETETPNEMDIITINESLIGILQPHLMKELNSKIFKDTDTEGEDDSTFLQYLFNYGSTHKIKIKLIEKNYNIGERIEIHSNLDLDMNKATFNLNDGAECEMLYNYDNISTQTSYIENIHIYNGSVDGNSTNNHSANASGMFISLVYGKNIIIENLTITDCERIPINIKLSKNIEIRNIDFSNIALQSSTYISGGNYAIALEGNDSITTENIKLENITVNNYSSGAFHLYKLNNANLNNIKITGGLSSPQSSDPITYTKCTNVVNNGLLIDTASNCGLELNQANEFISFINCDIKNITTGLILSNNSVSGTINKNIIFTNCNIIPSSAYLALINYTQDIYFNNCKLAGKLGGSTDDANIRFENCVMTSMDFNSFTTNLATTFTNCEISTIDNHYYNVIKYSSKDSIINLITYGDITANSTLEVPMYLIYKNPIGITLNVYSYYDGDKRQNYQAIYLMNLYDGPNTNIKLSEKINGLGDSVREIVPSLSTTNKFITLTNNQSVNLKFMLIIKN